MRVGKTRGMYVFVAKPMGVVGAILQAPNYRCNNGLCAPPSKTFCPIHNDTLVTLTPHPTQGTFRVNPLVSPRLSGEEQVESTTTRR